MPSSIRNYSYIVHKTCIKITESGGLFSLIVLEKKSTPNGAFWDSKRGASHAIVMNLSCIVHMDNKRQDSNLNVSFAPTNRSQILVLYKGNDLPLYNNSIYNNLLTEIKSIPNKDTFKMKLKSHFISFYNDV